MNSSQNIYPSKPLVLDLREKVSTSKTKQIYDELQRISASSSLRYSRGVADMSYGGERWSTPRAERGNTSLPPRKSMFTPSRLQEFSVQLEKEANKPYWRCPRPSEKFTPKSKTTPQLKTVSGREVDGGYKPNVFTITDEELQTDSSYMSNVNEISNVKLCGFPKQTEPGFLSLPPPKPKEPQMIFDFAAPVVRGPVLPIVVPPVVLVDKSVETDVPLPPAPAPVQETVPEKKGISSNSLATGETISFNGDKFGLASAQSPADADPAKINNPLFAAASKPFSFGSLIANAASNSSQPEQNLPSASKPYVFGGQSAFPAAPASTSLSVASSNVPPQFPFVSTNGAFGQASDAGKTNAASNSSQPEQNLPSASKPYVFGGQSAFTAAPASTSLSVASSNVPPQFSFGSTNGAFGQASDAGKTNAASNSSQPEQNLPSASKPYVFGGQSAFPAAPASTSLSVASSNVPPQFPFGSTNGAFGNLNTFPPAPAMNAFSADISQNLTGNVFVAAPTSNGVVKSASERKFLAAKRKSRRL